MVNISSVFLIGFTLVFSSVSTLSQLMGFVFLYFCFGSNVDNVVLNELSPQPFIGELSDLVAEKRIVFLNSDEVIEAHLF